MTWSRRCFEAETTDLLANSRRVNEAAGDVEMRILLPTRCIIFSSLLLCQHFVLHSSIDVSDPVKGRDVKERSLVLEKISGALRFADVLLCLHVSRALVVSHTNKITEWRRTYHSSNRGGSAILPNAL